MRGGFPITESAYTTLRPKRVAIPKGKGLARSVYAVLLEVINLMKQACS